MYRAEVMSREGAESGSRRSKKTKTNKQQWFNREEEWDSKTMERGLNVLFFFSRGKEEEEEVEVLRETGGRKKE